MNKHRILVVDDDQPVCDAFKKLLEIEGFAVLTAANQLEAVEQFRTHAIDLVILDINLGEDSGWDVLRIIRQFDPAVPVVMITAESLQLESAIAAGADFLVEKPIDVPSCLETIGKLLRRKSSRARGERPRCRHVPRDYATFLRLLQERGSRPFALSAQIRAALPGRKCTNPSEGSPNRLTVIGDPTTLRP